MRPQRYAMMVAAEVAVAEVAVLVVAAVMVVVAVVVLLVVEESLRTVPRSFSSIIDLR